MQRECEDQIEQNRLRVKTSIDIVRFLSFQGIAFRGLRYVSYLSTHVHTTKKLKIVYPKNAKYTSPETQKEILSLIAEKVRKKTVQDIGDSKFCILVDESSDESKKEQMAIDTSSATLYSSICGTLSSYHLTIENILGQGYDGASNMRGEWKGLQALFLKKCPYLSFIVNAIGASCKRHDELQAAEIAKMVEIGELETGTGANQIGTITRAGDTRWSSHLNSISSLLRMYNPACTVLDNIKRNGSNYKTKGDASTALKRMTSFEFVFILHMMKQVLGIADVLYFRDNKWSYLLQMVIEFCNKHEIDIPNFDAPYFEGRGSKKRDHITNEHHFHFDIFNEAIDFQLQEIDSRFNEKVVELLQLTSTLDPRDGYRSFNVDSTCKLARKYYFLDFTEQDIEALEFQLKHFEVDVNYHSLLQKTSSLAKLCQDLAESGKASHYYLVDRLIRLVLTLPVSTATSERAFSAMKIVKTRLRNKMDDDFISDSLVLYIEKDIAKDFSLDSLLDDFNDADERRVQLKR
ncbi:zinc finger MYM-type protein 1-like protein [Tanacetum coccineum]